MDVLVIDCIGIGTRDQFWDRYLTLSTPENAEGFGRNLDALWDALERDGPGRLECSVLRLKRAESLAVIESGAFLKHLQDIAADLTRLELRIELVDQTQLS